MIFLTLPVSEFPLETDLIKDSTGFWDLIADTNG